MRRFQPLIAKVVLRVSRQWGECSPQIVDDLIQETYLKFCSGGLRGLQDFRSAHEDAIFGFVKVFTANLAHDHFKALRSKKRGGATITDSIDGKKLEAGEPSVSFDPEREVLLKQIDACLRRLASDRDRRIFWLYYRMGWAASAIAALPQMGLGTKGVESTILRLTKQVKIELAARGRERSLSGGAGKGIEAAESL